MPSTISSFDFYLLRTPRLPSRVIQELNAIHSLDAIWDYFKIIFKDPDLLDAIYIASEDLYWQLVASLKGDTPSNIPKLLPTLYKYTSRMAGRPTPYGKFSGVALGDIVEMNTALELSGQFLSSYRLDMDFSAHLSKSALNSTDLRDMLLYYSNNTLYEMHDGFRYIEYYEVNGKRRYRWIRINRNPLLSKILNVAKNGMHFSKLSDTLAQMGVPYEWTANYLYQLIDVKLLISELEPSVTGKLPDRILATKLKGVKGDSKVSVLLEKTQRLAKDTNRKNGFISPNTKQHLSSDGWSGRNIFQADLRLGVSHNCISNRIIENLSKELEDLLALKSMTIPLDLQTFCRNFLARYGEKEIPLLEALDQDSGVGYGTVAIRSPENSPLLNGLGAPHSQANESPFSQLMFSVIDRYWSSSTKTTFQIELNQQEICAFHTSSKHRTGVLPAGFYALGNLIASDCKALENGDYQFNLLAGGGVSSIPLMTRFCHLDKRLEEKLRDCIAFEDIQIGDALFAEVVFLPENRVGNILFRPNLRKYEIPVLGQSSVDEEFRIHLNDLWVSVVEGKAVLRSKRLGKVIIPRLSSAHNYHYGMVVYRFLCDLQYQTNVPDISWDWGALSSQSFLPRVTYKHIILTRARWYIKKESIKSLSGDNKTKVAQLKAKFGLPDVVCFTEGDNELPIDLNHPIGAEIIMKQLKKSNLILYEYLFKENNSPVTDAMGARYNNEVIIPFKVNRPTRFLGNNSISKYRVRRRFHPGSEWAFVKIYCSTLDAERILCSQISALISKLEDFGTIKKWFFIRYYESGFHLRLRFLLSENVGNHAFQFAMNCINDKLEPLLNNGVVHRVLFDTYDRELERYGEDNMELCESIFHLDSNSTLAMLPLFKGDYGEHQRWLSAARGVDHLLTAFRLDMAQKLSLVTMLRDAFFIEFSSYDKLQYKLNLKYRLHRNSLEEFFHPNNQHSTGVHRLLYDRYKNLTTIIDKLKIASSDYSKKHNLIASLAHMFINRHFPTNQREHEMVLYHFLSKLYLSMAKKRSQKLLKLISITL